MRLEKTESGFCIDASLLASLLNVSPASVPKAVSPADYGRCVADGACAPAAAAAPVTGVSPLDAASGGCAGGTPPENLGFRRVRDQESIVAGTSAFRPARRYLKEHAMITKMRRMPDVRLPASHETVVERLRRGIAEAGLDCSCRTAANEMLDRVGVEEDLVRRASDLADARKMRDAIVVVLALLDELDELTPDEPDRSAFHEIAGLFQDVADFAAYGATSSMRAAGQGNA